MKLKNKPDVLVAKIRQLSFVECCNVGAVYNYLPVVGFVQSADNLQQSGFSGTARTHYRNYFVWLYFEADAFEHFQTAKTLGYIAYFNHYRLFLDKDSFSYSKRQYLQKDYLCRKNVW